jgi:2-polyprenyl-3-methyl-5-hydroxy-6-metoxy-1,4-benzoquinol methylase
MAEKRNSTTLNTKCPTLEEQRRFWNSHWQHWQDRKVLNDLTRRRADVICSVFRSLQLERPEILDLGCGMGWFAEELASFGNVTGIDLSEEAIAQAKVRCPQAKFMAANILVDSLPGERFDVVVSQEVLAHVEDQSKYIRVAAELLKPGGYLILTTANKFVMDHLGQTKFTPCPPEHIENFLHMKDLKRLLHPYFHVLRTMTINPTVGSGGILRVTNSHKLNTALGLLVSSSTLEEWKERAGLGYSLLALARKR